MPAKHLLAALGILILQGCMSGNDSSPGSQSSLSEKFAIIKNETDPNRLTIRGSPVNQVQEGWDDFPNIQVRPDTDNIQAKYALVRLQFADMRRLPFPMGLRYYTAPEAEVRSLGACSGTAKVVSILDTAKGIFIRDSISYLDSLGRPHCGEDDAVRIEKHNRYVLDLNAGEGWDRLQVRYEGTETGYRYLVEGSGRMTLAGGMRLDIDKFKLEMDLSKDKLSAYAKYASMEMALAGGYTLGMWYNHIHQKTGCQDFFPFWGNQPKGAYWLQGEIRHRGVWVGHIHLMPDRSVLVRDWYGKRVKPSP